jgi:ATP-binding cassette subfamily F protein 3
LIRYGGNYSKFEDMRAEQMSLQQNAFAKQQDKIAHLQKFIARFKAKASKAKQAQSRVKALDRMEKIAPLMSDADFQFEFKEPANLPNPMLSMQHVDFGYAASKPTEPDASPTIIVRDVSKSVLAGQRIGILGANGQGKSTVVKTIARDLPALSGDITEGKGLNIGYFAQQELDVLRPADNPLEHMIALLKKVTTEGKLSGQATREQDLRSYLGQFNFGGDMVKQSVGSMSGGEKARLVLCMMVWQRPNLLLLDEPTNHLDLTTREALSMALNEFEGTVMLVSHDRALLRAVCDEFWLVSKGGIAPFDGDLDDYQQFLFEEAKRLKALAQSETVASTPKAAPAVIKNSKPSQQQKTFQKQQQLVESDMQDLELEKTRLLEAMSATTLTDELMALGKQLKVAENKLSELEVQWLELLESSEQA